jgi:ureidoglycolate lyase
VSRSIKVQPLTASAFAPYGDVLEATGTPDKIINQGMCGRFHDRAQMDFTDGRAGISIFQGEKRSLPLTLDLVERHPEGSQAFVPVDPRAFVTTAGQAINFHRGTWHGVLTPLSTPGLFAVIDRIGAGDNLQEHRFDQPYLIEA